MNGSPHSSESRAPWIIFGLVLVLALVALTTRWSAPILDRHEFRQVQTAVSAYWIRETGWKLDYETPLFGPPWSIPMEFPVYQVIVGKLSAWLGTGLEPTGRAVSLAFLLAALPAVYGLAGLFGLAASRRLLVVAAVLATPTYLFYGRTLMIETTALCFSLWFMLGVGRAVRDGSVGWSAVAACCGTLAALAKVTTFLIHCPPAALLAAWLWWQRPAARPGVLRAATLAGVPVAIAFVIGWLWVRHADGVKQSNPFSGFLTSAELTKWNWGTLEQRLSADFWAEFWRNCSAFILSEHALVPLLVGCVVAPPLLRRIALVAAACFLAAVLLFSNLFYFHDYYYNANAALLAIGAGLLLVALWDDARLPQAVRLTLVIAYFAGQALIFHRGYADYLRRDLPEPPGIAEILRTTTPQDGVVLVYGWDWNGVVPYYAQRRAIMVPRGREDDVRVLEDIVAQLGSRKIVALVISSDPLRGSPSFARWRTDRFHLAPAPLATSGSGDVYLAEELVEPARRALAGRTFAGVALNLNADTESPFPATQAVPAATVALPLFSPAPAAARTLHGMNAGDAAGAPALHAHAPSELEFVPPAGARHLTFAFGLPDAAWKGGAAVTDGIGIEVFERLPNGQRRTLFRRLLDPAHEAADRGTQRVELRDVGPFAGRLFFRFTTGPRDNVTNDWAYWAGIEIR